MRLESMTASSQRWRRKPLFTCKPAFLLLLGWASSLLHVTTAAASCDPSLLPAGCVEGLIPYEAYTEAFPVIEYCVTDYHGFLSTTRENCDLAGGVWTVRPGE